MAATPITAPATIPPTAAGDRFSLCDFLDDVGVGVIGAILEEMFSSVPLGITPEVVPEDPSVAVGSADTEAGTVSVGELLPVAVAGIHAVKPH